MIDYGDFFKILTVFSLALISPGPDFMIVSSMSLNRGCIDGIKSAAGTTLGISVYVLISLTGLSVLFMHYLWVGFLIRLCGGLYLIYLGFSMWRASLGIKRKEALVVVDVKQKNAFWVGALTNLTNAKAIAFFSSIFALVLTPDMSLETKVALGVAIPAVNFMWFSFVAFCLSKDNVRARYQRWRQIIDRTVGTIMSFFGLKLLFSLRG